MQLGPVDEYVALAHIHRDDGRWLPCMYSATLLVLSSLAPGGPVLYSAVDHYLTACVNQRGCQANAEQHLIRRGRVTGAA